MAGSGNSIGRVQVTKEEVEEGFERLKQKLYWRLNKKGWGTFASCHEIGFILQEEMKEYGDAVHHGTNEERREELLDIAVGAVFGEVCIKEKKVDW